MGGVHAPAQGQQRVGARAAGAGGDARSGAVALALRVARHRDALAVAAVLLVALLVYWRMLRSGGLFFDDFWHRAAALYDGEAKEQTPFFGYFEGLWEITGFRPTLVPILAFEIWIADGNPHAYQALAMADTLFAAFGIYAALRIARVPWGVCTAAAVLFVCLPIAGATRFWLAGGIASVAMGLVFWGLFAGGLAFRAESRRRGLALHALSVALIVSGVLAYDAALGLLALTLPFYLAITRLRWRASLVKATLDVAACGLVLLLFHSRSAIGADPRSAWDDHARLLLDHGTDLFFAVLTIDRSAGSLVVLVLLGAALFLAVKVVLDPGGWWAAARPEMGRAGLVALALIAVGCLAALAGYAAYIPAGWYDPLNPGQGDRTNGVASAGFAVAYAGVAFGLAVVLGTALHGRSGTLLRGGLFAVLVALASVSFVQQSRVKGDQYIRVWQMSDEVVTGLAAAFPDGPPPPGTMVYSFGHRAQAAPMVKALADWGDLDGAVKLTLGTGQIRAMPIFAPQPLVCAAERVEVPPPFGGPSFSEAEYGYYGKVVFVNPLERRAETIRSAAQCRRALTRFIPVPQ